MNLSFAVSLRKEGEVPWLESPNGLGATAQYQDAGECRTTLSRFSAVGDKRGVDLISDALPFGRLRYGEPNAVANATGYAEHCSRSHDAVIRVYDDVGNVIETYEYTGDFKEA